MTGSSDCGRLGLQKKTYFKVPRKSENKSTYILMSSAHLFVKKYLGCTKKTNMWIYNR